MTDVYLNESLRDSNFAVCEKDTVMNIAPSCIKKLSNQFSDCKFQIVLECTSTESSKLLLLVASLLHENNIILL